ncbi:MAG: class I SAM-dependent methyltransferase [Candidatus Nitrospinota bacterium M3_3B_026]
MPRKNTTRPGAGDLYKTQREYYKRVYSSGGPAPWDTAFDGEWLERKLKSLGLAGGRRALDLGAGRGRGARILKKAGWRVAAMDYLAEPLAGAKGRTDGGAWLVQGDAFEPPFAPRSFDLALDWGVFHHTRRRDTAAFLRSVTALLKPSGVFLLGCFSTKFRHPGEKRRKRNWTRHNGHYDRFSTRSELRGLFSPFFLVDSIDEDPKGFYLLAMTLKERT